MDEIITSLFLDVSNDGTSVTRSFLMKLVWNVNREALPTTSAGELLIHVSTSGN